MKSEDDAWVVRKDAILAGQGGDILRVVSSHLERPNTVILSPFYAPSLHLSDVCVL